MSVRKRSQRRNSSRNAGSISEPVFVLVGILRRPHGLHGEALVALETDFPERLQKGAKLFLGEEHNEVSVRSRRVSNEGMLLAFEEFDSREALEPYRNARLFVRSADLPALADGQVYHHQLIGFDVLTEEGRELGKLVRIMETGANDVYVVRTYQNREILLPATRQVIRRVDLQNKKMIVHLLPGLVQED